ncbi:transcriptional repressor LexA [Streptomyces candidus]|uniref:Repressor LexA n=1 Tax=Streptomyces candidus TaxID=67283 RepID=A0A7X0HMC6_9ACTN|nr:transcriptional repressor LexA [Streptomyces candidus]MBB6439039.1 repressor LexA [Streptomyces candidus]GHH55415.1 LexA repressor [Streptomyces candidus]
MNDSAIHLGVTPARDDADLLTLRQRAVLDCITASIRTRGYSPSMREIGKTVGLSSTTSVAHHLRELERKGFLHRDPHRPRACALTARALALVSDPQPTAFASHLAQHVEEDQQQPAVAWVPLITRFTVDAPHQSGPQGQEMLPMPRRVVGEGELFAVTMRGQSMNEAQICDGDVLTVRRQRIAAHNDIVAALLDDDDGEATVRKLQIADGRLWLMPCSPAFDPIPVKSSTAILGKVVAVLRPL